MRTLGYLDYYHNSRANGINDAGDVVGTSVDANGISHAVAWLGAGGAVKDLNALIPPTAGWTIEEAFAINNGGDIVGHGLVGGQEHAFVLTRYTGPNTQPPLAVVTATTVPAYVGWPSVNIAVKFWDYEKVRTSSVQGTGAVYVKAPGGTITQGVCTSWTTLDSQTINAGYTIAGPGGTWGPEDNGTYEIHVAANRVTDIAGNVMPDTLIGTFTIGYQTAAVFNMSGLPTTATTGTPVSLTLTATGSYPSAAGDVFNFAIDWNGDGSAVQTVSGTTGTVVSHTYTTNGARTVRAHCTDPHGVQSADSTAAINVTQSLATTSVVATGVPGITMSLGTLGAVNGGTMYFFQGANVITWNYPTAGALPASTATLTGNTGPFAGAGVDSRGRVILFGGSNSDSGALTSARSYPSAGNVAAMPGALSPPSTLAFVNMTSAVTTSDNLGRMYVYSGMSGVFFRYTAGTAGSGTWENLPAPPATPGGMCWDRGDRIIVFGATPSVFSISQNVWTQPFTSPQTFNHAVLGVDGLIYLVATNQLWTFDPVLNTFAQIATTAFDESGTAILYTYVSFAFRGTDGFLYLIGENPSTGSVNIEKFDTRPTVTITPYISSTPATTIVQGTPAASPWTYIIAASGKPRPTFSLDSGPSGMSVDSATGIVTWTPTPAQLGNANVVVRATNNVGAVTQSFTLNVLSSVYADTTPPTPPVNIVVANVTSTTADISWDPGTDDVGVAGYILYNRTVAHSPKGSGSTTYYTAIGSTSGTSLHLSGLKPYTSYPYFLVSVDAAGNKSGYVSAGFTTTYIAPPGITNGNNGPNAGTYAVVGQAFTSVAFTGSGLPAPTLAVVSAPAGAVWNSPAGTSGSFTWTPVAGQEGTATFTLAATNTSGTYTQTYTVQVYPAGTDLVAPSTPGSLVMDQVGWSSVRATWTASTDNVAVTGYQITATHLDSRIHPPPYNDQIVSTTVAATVLQTTITGLIPSTSYDVTVQAFDAAGNVSIPATAQSTTLPQPFVALPQSAATPGASAMMSSALAMSPAAAGLMTMTWPGSGYYWQYTVQSTSDFTTWTPVAPASQWPNFSTSYTIPVQPGVPSQYYRVLATPCATP
jgi:probable HAF family extracellular repeat protein